MNLPVAYILLAQAVGSQNHSDHVEDAAIGIATIVIGAFVAWLTTKLTMKSDERRAIREENMRLLEWAIEYPFLEDSDVCSKWPEKVRDKDDCMRYDNYCCHVFNVLQHSWEFCGGNRKKMRTVLYPEELIWRHRRWWKHDEANLIAYPVEFRTFVNNVIGELEKKEKVV